MEYYLGNRVIYKKSKIIQLVLVIIMLELNLYPIPAKAEANINQNNNIIANLNEISGVVNNFIFEKNQETKETISEEPKEQKIVAWTKKYTVTAYNSDVAQCDSSPCITANGFNVCKHGIEDTVAANFLPFGTEIRIPELFGDRVFVVRDRMNSRYTDRVDIWFIHRDNAIDFGVKYLEIEVLK